MHIIFIIEMVLNTVFFVSWLFGSILSPLDCESLEPGRSVFSPFGVQHLSQCSHIASTQCS